MPVKRQLEIITVTHISACLLWEAFVVPWFILANSTTCGCMFKMVASVEWKARSRAAASFILWTLSCSNVIYIDCNSERETNSLLGCSSLFWHCVMWTCIATTSVDLQLWKDNAGRGSLVNHNAVMRSCTGSVTRDPSNLWPVFFEHCGIIWCVRGLLVKVNGL